MIGRQLGRFKIIEKIGAGGMGEVYRARDEHLHRDVALKLLPEGRLDDRDARSRFRREALALSQLNHPNIGTVHDFDRQDGIDFIVMELVPGTSLADRLSLGVLAETEIRHLGVQLALGLAAAHEHGVVHRDMKPGNLHVTPDGRLKILDFGISKMLVRPADVPMTTELTETGAVTGTLAYLAPEHLRGEPVDARADVYGAGAVLYEMATGKKLFPADTAAELMYAIINKQPAAPTQHRPELSPDLEATILHALDKDPGNRPSAAELAKALESGAPARVIRGRHARLRRISWLSSAAAVVVVVVLGVVLERTNVLERWFAGPSNIAALAVLPLVRLSPDPELEYFVDGMTEELITGLARVGVVRVISRASVMPYKGSRKTLRDIAKDLHVDAVVTGSVQQAGSRVSIRAQLIRVKAEEHLWADSFDRDVGDVLAMTRDAVRAIVSGVAKGLDPEHEARLPVARRVDPEAHSEYLRGRYQWHRFSVEGWRQALQHFQRSIELDPEFAPAHAGLSETYAMMASNVLPPHEALPRARAAAQRALDLDSTLASGHAALAYVRANYERNWQAAEQGYQRAIELNPNDQVVRQNYGYMLLLQGRLEASERQFREAHQLDPISPMAACMELWPMNYARRYSELIPRARALLQAEPALAPARLLLAQALVFSGDAAAAVPEFELASRQMDVPLLRGWVGYGYARVGRRAEAESILVRLEAHSGDEYVQSYAMAIVHVGLGHNEETLDWLEKAVQEGSEEVAFMKVDRALDPLRSHPRYAQLLARLGLEP